jgi:hypothetical protein
MARRETPRERRGVETYRLTTDGTLGGVIDSSAPRVEGPFGRATDVTSGPATGVTSPQIPPFSNDHSLIYELRQFRSGEKESQCPRARES